MPDGDNLVIGNSPAVNMCNRQTLVERSDTQRIVGDRAAFDFRNLRGAGIRGQGGPSANSSGSPDQYYYGVWGDAQNDNPNRLPSGEPVDFTVGKGVRGTSRTGIGVDGDTETGIGVRGSTVGRAGRPVPTIDEAAVIGRSNNDIGVVGSSNASYGVLGYSYGIQPPFGGPITRHDNWAPGQIGVRGFGGGTGVYGSSYGGDAVLGYSEPYHGVFGVSERWTGVLGQGAVSGTTNDTSGPGVRGVGPPNVGVWPGVLGQEGRSGGIGVQGRGYFAVRGNPQGATIPGHPGPWAGYFEGDVIVFGQLHTPNSRFRIDHPLDPANRYLNHSCVESNEMKNVYDGVKELDEGGAAWVELPEWFKELNRDFRYQLTAIGEPAPELHIAEEFSSENNSFRIAGGKEGLKVCWQVTGVRKDRWAETHPLEVEQEKLEEDRGRYLHPDLYGAPEEQVIGGRLPEPPTIDFPPLREQREESRRQMGEQEEEGERRSFQPRRQAPEEGT